jgi:seryl-tRNA synthetase
MLDIELFRTKPKIIKDSEKKRGKDPILVDNIIKLDGQWRTSKQKLQKLQQKRNVVSLEINQLKKQKKSATTKIKEMRKVVASIKTLEEKTTKFLKKREELRSQVGNILHKTVPKGKDDTKNVTIKSVGKRLKFNFKIKDHIELGRDLDLFDFNAGSNVAGARFVYYKNEAAILDLALQRYAVDKLIKAGFTITWPPLMLNKNALKGGVNLSEFEDTIYKIENEDLYLIGTSEHPLIVLAQGKLFEEKELPVKIGAFSSCFRREAGVHGRDDKGIYRMHQFNKVEQVMFCKPGDSDKYFKELQKNAEKIFEELGLPFRVVNICTGDLGNKQHLQYDIELWLPGQNNKKGNYREATSCSNCLSYQAESVRGRFVRKDGKKDYIHTLNNTAIATPRVIIAILENFQQKDGSVKIPKALWKYTGFKVIKPKRK